MKVAAETVVELPVDRVVELFDDDRNMEAWQPGLLGRERIEGTPRRVGARTRLRCRMRGREVEMIETVTARNLPGEYACTYETKGVWSACSLRFEALGPGRTRVGVEQDYRFSGAMRLFALAGSGAFEQEARNWLESFKRFAEARGPGGRA